jgi:septal ring factor EnvC (AmiA/AmiB activator)
MAADHLSWIAATIAIAGMIRGEWAAMTARQVARDKLVMDAKLVQLQVEHDYCKEQHQQTLLALKECETGHKKLMEQMEESQKDRAEMRGRLGVLEKQLQSSKN